MIYITNNTLMMRQKGIAQIFVLLILLAGIIGGVYLIKNRTNILPKAASNLPNTAQSVLLYQAQAPVDKLGNRIIFQSEKPGVGQNPRYYVEYQPPFDLFMLVVNDTPIEQVREEAEKELLQKAGNNLQSLCKLKFSIIADKQVTDDGYFASDETLGICKELQSQLGSRLSDNFTPSLGNTVQSIKSAIIQRGGKSFLSDKPVVASQNLPNGVYMTLCRNNGTNAEGVWQISQNHQEANFVYNQEVGRCNWPVPNYLVFTQDVPTGTYLSLCEANNESEAPQESVWQVNNSGKVADFLYTQDGCSQAPPLPQPKLRLFSFPVSGQRCSSVHQGYCSVEFLTPYFGDNASTASLVCFAESSGDPFNFNGADAGLFQINLSSHGETADHWFNIDNNINKAVAMSGGGINWRKWSVAYDYACIDGRRINACGLYPGRVPWQKPC